MRKEEFWTTIPESRCLQPRNPRGEITAEEREERFKNSDLNFGLSYVKRANHRVTKEAKEEAREGRKPSECTMRVSRGRFSEQDCNLQRALDSVSSEVSVCCSEHSDGESQQKPAAVSLRDDENSRV